MPLASYGVLAGRVTDARAEGGQDTPHFQIRVAGGEHQFRVAVNVLSQESPSELLYLADESFHHPLLRTLPDLPDGFTALRSQPGGLALDYIRGNLFDRQDLRALPATRPGPDNDLADKLHHFVDRAAADPGSRIYAFGQRWGPEAGRPDKVFRFSPGNGVHDVHMNQGNSDRFRADDGVWQDGGLLLHFPGADQWVGVFLAFQSQAWHTDDETGHAISGPPETERVVRIVAALVNPAGPAPEAETVTLVNAGRHEVDLVGWTLVDRLKHRMTLDHVRLPAGEAARIRLRSPVELANGGGLLTLLDPDGLKIDGVSYTGRQAEREGWSVVF